MRLGVRGQHLLAVLPVGSATDPVLYHEELAPVKKENDAMLQNQFVGCFN